MRKSGSWGGPYGIGGDIYDSPLRGDEKNISDHPERRGVGEQEKT